ncbi:cardiolipin synthase [Paenibacillus wynnii]|uniref:Cardiolipin synthase n=1 Tax=Paenibacillus wynnii TaxID=268407 RepID=A0A098MC87_9BACL|nr:cardiolipin synthase [Paenibacillus wynnii]KGE19167.1 cardiolipin synthase [Paenibacillus wynnii]
MKIVAIIFCLFYIQMAVILLLEFRHPQRTVAWLFILLCCPPLGLLFYYYLGRDYRQIQQINKRKVPLLRELREHVKNRCLVVENPEDSGNPAFNNQMDLLQLLSHLPKGPITGKNQSRFLFEGHEAFDAMLEAMESAQEHIHLEFYTFNSDIIGERFQELLIRKARQGVKVRLLCDGTGSLKLSRKFIKQLKSGGVEFHFFLPPLLSFMERRLNYRNHRKILIVDGLIGFTGGMNVGDDYLLKATGIGSWRDTHLQLEGDCVYYLQFVFLKDWRLASGERLSHPRLFPVHPCQGTEAVKIVISGPDEDVDASEEICFASLCAAKRRIWITTPYFIPDSPIIRALKTARLRGVEVMIMIPGKPDVEFVYQATLSYVEDLQDAGVKFYKYRGGFIHAKIIIVDDLLVSVGGPNLDMRSLYTNFECSAVLLSPDSIAKITAKYQEDLEHSDLIDPELFKKRGRLVKLRENLSRLLSPML